MSDLEAAVAQAAAVFESLGIPYILIGLAVSVWGEPRATIDADFMVWTGLGVSSTQVAGRGAR